MSAFSTTSPSATAGAAAARRLSILALAAALAVGSGRAAAHADASTASSAASLLPVAVSVAAPAVLLSGAAVFTVVAVEASAAGTVWVLERASDGVRTSVHFAGSVVGVVGSAVVATAVATGWVLSAAGTVVAFIPNAIGRALLHNERVTR